MLKLYNSLSRKVEEFKTLKPGQVGFYTCGPTVYDFAHIGNFRTYTTADLLIRTLKYNKYEVKYIMNLTDVGHLTGDNLGDADTGEDRMEKSAKKEGKTAWEIAEFYSDQFIKDYKALNLVLPEQFVKATDHIQEQIDLILTLEKKGFTYTTSDGVYFDTSVFPNYGELSNLDQIKEGARVEINPEKKNPRDFALWKFSVRKKPVILERSDNGAIESPQRILSRSLPLQDDNTSKRQMEWDSPWAPPSVRGKVKGFPGWHIECSAMSMKYLGPTFDIHVGGIDLRETHHPNEIAQSEAATGKPFVKYWVHSAFMLVQGERMSKSKGNNYRLYDLEKEGYTPMALRYLYMQTHYRQEMNFTFAALDGATQAFGRLREITVGLKNNEEGGDPSGTKEFDTAFLEAVNDDLNMPRALGVMWEMIKSDASNTAKLQSLLQYDTVLGFDLVNLQEQATAIPMEEVPEDVKELIFERQQLRQQKQYALADQLRNKIKKTGYVVMDTKKGIEIRKM